MRLIQRLFRIKEYPEREKTKIIEYLKKTSLKLLNRSNEERKEYPYLSQEDRSSSSLISKYTQKYKEDPEVLKLLRVIVEKKGFDYLPNFEELANLRKDEKSFSKVKEFMESRDINTGMAFINAFLAGCDEKTFLNLDRLLVESPYLAIPYSEALKSFKSNPEVLKILKDLDFSFCISDKTKDIIRTYSNLSDISYVHNNKACLDYFNKLIRDGDASIAETFSSRFETLKKIPEALEKYDELLRNGRYSDADNMGWAYNYTEGDPVALRFVGELVEMGKFFSAHMWAMSYRKTLDSENHGTKMSDDQLSAAKYGFDLYKGAKKTKDKSQELNHLQSLSLFLK